MVPRVILFTPSHSRRVLVPKVDFISAPGTSPSHIYRPGGPHALVTDKCVFTFDRHRGRFGLNTLHRGQELCEVLEHTGFEFDYGPQTPVTPEPDRDIRGLLRGPVLAMLRETYPAFVGRHAGARSSLG
jgi:glutaconate CoA-transferase subunit B